jgi:tetratricopeptide (TPR) repeat protein
MEREGTKLRRPELRGLLTLVGGLAVAATLQVAFAAEGAAAAGPPSLPSLPVLALDTYEAGIREPIAEAYRAVREQPNDAARNGRLGMLLYANEQYELAEPCFERARALAPGDAAWAYYLGRAQIYLARPEKAAAALRAALVLQPGYFPARLMLAKSLLDAGHEEESRSLYQQLVTEHPDTAEAYYGLGRIAAARGDTAEAVRYLEQASGLYAAFGAAHFALARAYRDLGQKDKAEAELVLYQKDKAGWPSVPDPLLASMLELKTGANALLRKGIELADAGDLKGAAEEHEKALAADPKLVRARVNLIRIYGTLGQPTKAEEQYRAAIAIDPSSAEAHNNYAFLLMTSGRLAEAAEVYRKALASQPDHRAAHFNLGRILVNQGLLAEAIEHFRQTLLPDDEEAPRYLYALGAAYARAGNREEALRFLREAREKATGRGQAELLASIERDLRALEQAAGRR